MTEIVNLLEVNILTEGEKREEMKNTKGQSDRIDENSMTISTQKETKMTVQKSEF